MSKISFVQVNRFVLKKQHLAGGSKTTDAVQITKDIGGLHGTCATSPYLSLFARSPSFRREDLAVIMAQKKSLSRIRYVRNTVYILPKDLVPVAFAGTGGMAEVTASRFSRDMGMSPAQYARIANKILKILKGRGLTTREIKQKLRTAANVSPIVNLMCDRGLLVRGLPREGWKSIQHVYFLFEDFYPDVDLSAFDEREARKIIVRQYLLSFGPVCERDIVWWTDFPKSQVKELLGDLGDEVSSVEIPEWGGGYVIHASESEPLRSIEDFNRPAVNVLPCLDPYLMGYKERKRLLYPKYEKMVFDRSGNATSVILVDGQAAAVWDWEEPSVKVFYLRDLGGDIRKRIRAKVSEMGKFISGKPVHVKECRSMVPLTKRTAGSFRSPLKDC